LGKIIKSKRIKILFGLELHNWWKIWIKKNVGKDLIIAGMNGRKLRKSSKKSPNPRKKTHDPLKICALI